MVIDLTLLDSQKNDIALIIKNFSLNISDFSINQIRNDLNELIDCVVYNEEPTKYFFSFDRTGNTWHLTMSPGNESRTTTLSMSNWAVAQIHFAQWLTYLNREIEAPNLWDEFTKSSFKNSMENQIHNSNEQFTQNEQYIIATHIDSVIIQLKENDSLTPQQLDTIETELIYLKEQLKNQTKKAWMYELRGVIFTLIVERVIDSEIARELFTHIATKAYDVIKAIGA